MTHKFITEFNSLMKSFQAKGEDYLSHIGEGASAISAYSDIITKDIPEKLKTVFPEKLYIVKGSIGTGRITSCPWIAIMNKEETHTTQNGVYMAFLFSQDLKTVYLALEQGITDSKQIEIRKKRDYLREKLQMHSKLLQHKNNLELTGKIAEKYTISAIYANEWRSEDDVYCERLLDETKRAYKKYMSIKQDIQSGNDEENLKQSIASFHVDEKPVLIEAHLEHNTFSINRMVELLSETGLIFTPKLIKRFAFSLMAKPFVILSGIAGSGKTQLAINFASALVSDRKKQMCVASVGADWSNREPLLGFPNALQPEVYVKPESGVLDLLIEANKPDNADKPFFLILDEMNLSYVERYFADFLSVMESHEPIKLWEGHNKSNVPPTVSLTDNVFVIGTINVDETTYMFSPKVLDRANVIEFKVSEKEMERFLNGVSETHHKKIDGKAAYMALDFIEQSRCKTITENEEVKNTLLLFFKELKSINAEFGYRSATEILRFMNMVTRSDESIGGKTLSMEEITDAAIVQKLLPKLHGSRKKLEPVLQRLWRLCFKNADMDTCNISEENVNKAVYKESADKIRRMYDMLCANGFTSFAEA